MTGITLTLKRSRAMVPAANRNSAIQSIFEPVSPLPIVRAAMWAMKNKAMLAATPTTAAVIATRSAVKWALPWVDSTSSSPARMKMNEGRKVNQITTVAASTAPMNRLSGQSTCFAPRLRLGAGQQHAVVQRVQETPLADPAALLHQFAVHDGNLPGRAAKAEEAELEPESQGFAE